MANKSSPSHVVEDMFKILTELREDLGRHEQLLVEIREHLLAAQARQLSQQVSLVWIPPRSTEVEIKPIQPTLKIRKVVAPKGSSYDIIPRLSATRMGRLYTRHLKQRVLIRGVVRWIWRNGYPIYVNYLARHSFSTKARRWHSLIKLRDFLTRLGIPTVKLADFAVFETLALKVYPTSDESYLVSSNDRHSFPEIFVAIIPNAMIYGGTNLVLKDDTVVCHDMYDFVRDYTSEELHGRTLINPGSMRIRWLLHDEAPELIPVAATFVDSCAFNYAHWLTEVLPRIILFCADVRFRDIPIVVNDGLHKNIMESLFLFVGTEREIITLPIGRAMTVAELYVTSVTGYVPFGRRDTKLLDHSHGTFNPRSFDIFRTYVFEIGIEPKKGVWPDKIYLRRNLGTRLVVNSLEIENLLLCKGFTIIETEKLTFLEQMQLFSHASVIIAPTGAALANCIACKPGTKVAVLMSRHEDMIYGYWSNLLSPFGIKVNYVLGNIIENRDRGIHGDFAIDVDCINEMLNGFEEK